ncbi:SAM hydrolase/SAM-dependent halogenase family protein [Hyperthermus butylicus]|uniref:Universally conserved protein n=1 Tax=Hyperthermus butylicus (strain DSM 5456 / JCM 9403 / PLM1-5) TaxID=415426 RepID=A2BJ71_HYPBU|nr:S-adenosyl-l-methionine hydroxide adenosyltransferase family protein [Hyperthermus butylicus]ABM80032.1 universally conserved protein [Hyperthermus butylicus DSM 5456]
MAPRPTGVVVYMSDFGWSDPYAGIVRGVIDLVSGGRVRVIDLTHDVPAFSIVAGAYILYTGYRFFRPGTVFLVVVDPGVGTERRAIAVETRNYYFVGPDNGVLYPAIEEDGIVRVHEISNEAIFLKPVSMSFHGRDVFGPAAALLALGVPVSALGGPVEPSTLRRLSLRTQCINEGRVEAEVVYIDHFGNVALGLERDCVERLCRRSGRVVVETGRGVFEAKCLPVFSHAEPGEMVFYLNSLGFPELAVNLGNAGEKLGVRIGERLVIAPG